MLGLIVRAKAVYEWFNFAGEAVSLFGVAKRAAVAAGAVAMVAGGVSVAMPTSQARVVERAIEAHAPAVTQEVRDQVMKVNSENLYSKLFLVEPQNAALLHAILAICRDERALPHEQCAIAGTAEAHVVAAAREAEMIAARRKAEREAPVVSRLPMPWEF